MSPTKRTNGAARELSLPGPSDSAAVRNSELRNSELRNSESGSRNGASTRGLLSRARKGDQQSIGELLTVYRNYLTLLATTQLERRLRPRVSPSDIVQETMLKAHRHFAQFKGRSEAEFLGWLRQILLSSLAHFVERHLLAAKRNIRREISIEECATLAAGSFPWPSMLAAAHGETPSGEVQQREAKAVLSARLAKLSTRYRQVLVLRNIDGLSFDDVAVKLDCTPAAARMLWLRAIQKLRAIYRKAGEHDA